MAALSADEPFALKGFILCHGNFTSWKIKEIIFKKRAEVWILLFINYTSINENKKKKEKVKASESEDAGCKAAFAVYQGSVSSGKLFKLPAVEFSHV